MTDLAALIAKRERLDVERAIDIVIRCCKALADTQCRGISPAMFSLSAAGEITVELDHTKHELGYDAPEIVETGLAQSRLVDERFDGREWSATVQPPEHDETDWPRTTVFTLGCMLWELLAGDRLFLDELSDYHTMMRAYAAEVPPLRDTPADLEAIVRGALARNVDERYQTPRQFGDALAGYLVSRGLN